MMGDRYLDVEHLNKGIAISIDFAYNKSVPRREQKGRKRTWKRLI